MGCCRIKSKLTGRSRGAIQDAILRDVYELGPRAAFRNVRHRLHGRVLEVGCGTGVLFEEYPAETEVCAIEPDADFLPLAATNAQAATANISVVRGDAQSLPFADACFDGVVLHLVICSVNDPEKGLREVMRVLRHGGVIYVYEHVLAKSVAFRALQHVTSPLWTWMAEGCRWNRATDVLLRALPVRWELDERIGLKKGILPALPIARMLGTRQYA